MPVHLKPPSRHEAESLKRRAHHSPYTCTLTTLTFPENNLVVQPVHGKRLARTVLIFTERSDQLSRATDRVPGLPASPG
ncbi:hypothetical protein UL79_21935 [Shigella dysenteriae]|nr:hypothetical protein C5K22_05490 [Shigella dysenteriae]PQN58013.1 hypothetical protein C5K17_03910 [Shigella dysenteriae]RIG13640.1 hypothetical protein UL56_23630 [Shigella dysenteriae]RIH35672.1 hypothetical protein UL79_21935 [Shigella dysenteriae]